MRVFEKHSFWRLLLNLVRDPEERRIEERLLDDLGRIQPRPEWKRED